MANLTFNSLLKSMEQPLSPDPSYDIDLPDKCQTNIKDDSEPDVMSFMNNLLEARRDGRIIPDEEMKVVVEKKPFDSGSESDKAGKKLVETTKKFLAEAKELQEDIAEDKRLKKVRTYNKKVEKMKITFKDPKMDNSYSVKPMIILFAIIGIVVGCFFAFLANNYVQATNKSGEALEAVIQGFLKEYPWCFTAFDTSIMLPAFGIGFAIVAVMALLAITGQQEKNANRFGREHGKAKLANKNDFLKYKANFMDK